MAVEHVMWFMFDDLKVTSHDDSVARPTIYVTFTCYYCICTDIFVLTLGQWTVPSVSGQCCPPTEDFIIEKISRNKGIMFGGGVTNGNRNTVTNSVYLYQLSHNTMVN